NNMPPKRTSAAARADVAATAAVGVAAAAPYDSCSLMVMATKAIILALELEELYAFCMDSVFHISNYAVENQVKFATCTFLRNALTWWNSDMKTVTQDVAYAMD
ncbi:hypothetical protein Tco_1424766, partial [Tanacetum coccineum]